MRAFLAALCLGAVAAAPITTLPGYDATQFPKLDMDSGYISVKDRHLFYFFVANPALPADAPLVLWLNGGPGCSSIGGGLMSELGPFYPQHDGTLKYNEFGWHQKAHMLYVESPAGVGFSYADDAAEYTVGDERTASDLHSLLQQFVTQFPDMATRPFFVSGESYGGHYVPGLAAKILRSNAAGAKPAINLHGFLAGNAWTDAAHDNYGTALSWWGRSLISEETFSGLARTCNFSAIGPLLDEASAVDSALRPAARMLRAALETEAQAGETCAQFQTQAMREMGSINIYDIYVDFNATCGALATAQHAHASALLSAIGRPAPWSVNTALGAGPDTSAGGSADYDPCVDQAATAYLNRLDVQKAIHANTTLGYQWSTCSPRVNYSRADLLSSMLPTYAYLLDQPSIRALVFSGDVDGIVATLGSRINVAAMNQTVTKPWRPWTVDSQVGGYVTEYENGLTFATVRNAGHMVPYTQRERALHMFSRFVDGQSL